MRTPVAQRVWAKVDRSGGPDACWPFIGSSMRNGYGTINGGPERKWRPIPSHRVAYEDAVGPIPDRLSDRYHVREVLTALVELVVFLTLLFGIPAIIWLAAPQGAGYPS